jgi:yeast amino acid transporter
MENKDDKTVDASANDASSIETGSISGDVQYAGEQGSPKELHRNFKARHIQMIGLAGSIGSGLFIGTGKVCTSSSSPSSSLAAVDQISGSPLR